MFFLPQLDLLFVCSFLRLCLRHSICFFLVEEEGLGVGGWRHACAGAERGKEWYEAEAQNVAGLSLLVLSDFVVHLYYWTTRPAMRLRPETNDSNATARNK
jgi:hypothetical protein